MISALALGFTACSDDDDDNNGGQRGTITIGNKTEEVESAFSAAIPSQEGQEGGSYILFFEEDFKEFPKDEPNFFVGVLISDSSFGKQIDLTKALTKSGALSPYLVIGDPTHGIEIDETGVAADSYESGTETELTVSSGSMKATRNGDKFSVKFTVTFSDGHTIAGDWSGTPREGAELGS